MKIKKFISKLLLGLSAFALISCGAEKAESNDLLETTNILLSSSQQQLQFEENYVKSKFSYGEGGKFAIAMCSNIANIAAGIAYGSPCNVVGGIMGSLSSINDQFSGNKGPTIQDVMDKLSEMDTKLDEMNEKLDKNYNQLVTEEIRTQAMVDQVLLEEMENAITAFNTDYIVPLENHKRDFSDYMDQSLKAFVSEKETVNMYIYQGDDNDWGLVPVIHDSSYKNMTEVTFDIEDFTNSLEFLEKNYNVVEKGFMDSLYTDIENSLEDNPLPAKIDDDTYRNIVMASISEQIMYNYYSYNHSKALELRNLVINYSKQLSGKGTKSVIDRYVNRLEYMYNFAGEMKPAVTATFANMMHDLDVNVLLAAEACSFAETSAEEVRTEYINARESIQDTYEPISKIDDNYCFLTKSILDGGFYRGRFETKYTNKGNHCSFSSAFKFEKVVDDWTPHFYEDNVYDHNFVGPEDHTRIATRMKLMKELGLVKSDTYVEYLKDAGVMPAAAYSSYTGLKNKGWISDDAMRFFTGLESIRDMGNGDKDFTMQCTEAGNPGGSYFHVGWKGTFRAERTESKWHGKIAETKYVDARTGEIQADKRVAAYATYAEDHWYWSNDEYWSFIDNPAGSYFFILETARA